MDIEVWVSVAPRQVERHALTLPEGATVQQALEAAGWWDRVARADGGPWQAGVWGKLKPLDQPLRHLDRVELYRPLRVDPKEARRQRYRKEGKPSRQRARPASPSV